MIDLYRTSMIVSQKHWIRILS